MSPLSMLAAGGVWVAVPLTGRLLLSRSVNPSTRDRLPWLSWAALVCVVGFAVWSPVLLGAAIAGVFRPVPIGLLGWVIAIAARVWLGRPRLGRAPAISTWEWVLACGLAAAAVLYLGFPAESIYGGRDEGVYASHAVYRAQHGRLDVPYPWPDDAHAIFANNWVGFPGFYKTPAVMTVQFGHLLPVWMAQAYGFLGAAGLFRSNGILALLSVAVFYGVCRMLLPAGYAIVATLFLALNPSQLWMARMTLSEVPAQLCIWSGLLMLLHAVRDGERAAARWAGLFLGLSAFARFDSLLMVPMLFLAHLGMRLLEDPPGRSTPTWLALYETALPTFLLALGYFALFSTPYLMQRHYLGRLAVASVVAPLLLLGAQPGVIERIRPWLSAQPVLIGAATVWFALAAYAYVILPAPSPAPNLAYRWPGYYIDVTRDYSRDTLVNLGRYLSPPVVWAAIAGWFLAFWQLVRERRELHICALLVVILGVSLAHLVEPIPEDHFWVMRRFIPVAIPGFVFCAALGARWAFARLPVPAVLPITAATAAALAAFTVWADRLILTFSESRGYFTQIQQLASKLPPDQVIVARGFTEWVTPLYVAFDRRVVPLNLDPNGKGRRAFQQWVARETAQGRTVHLVVEGSTDLRGLQARLLDQVVITRVFSEPTMDPLPQQVISKQRPVRIYEITE